MNILSTGFQPCHLRTPSRSSAGTGIAYIVRHIQHSIPTFGSITCAHNQTLLGWWRTHTVMNPCIGFRNPRLLTAGTRTTFYDSKCLHDMAKSKHSRVERKTVRSKTWSSHESESNKNSVILVIQESWVHIDIFIEREFRIWECITRNSMTKSQWKTSAGTGRLKSRTNEVTWRAWNRNLKWPWSGRNCTWCWTHPARMQQPSPANTHQREQN